MASKRVHLVRPWHLGAIAAAVAVLFALLRPGNENLAGDGREAVSLAYLRALAGHSDDAELALRLARAELEAGRPDAAERHVAGLVGRADGLGARARQLAFDVEVARFRAAEGPDKESRRRALIGQAATLDSPPEQIAAALLELDAPAAASRAFERAQRLADAGRWALAAGEPTRAARLYLEAASRGESTVDEALEALEMTGPDDDVGPLLMALAEAPAVGAAPLERAIRLALGRGQVPAARQLLTRRVGLASAEAPVEQLRRDVALALEIGELRVALSSAERWVAAAPDDAEARETAARVAEWNGRPEQALPHYEHLAARGAGAALDRALSIARMLRRTRTAAGLAKRGVLEAPPSALPGMLSDLATEGELTAELLRALRDRLEGTGADPDVYRTIAAFQEQLFLFDDAVATLARSRALHGPSRESLLWEATLTWRLGRTEEAYGLLSGEAFAELADERAWQLRLELAYRLGRVDDTLVAAEHLLAVAPGEPRRREQLSALQLAAGHHARAIELALALPDPTDRLLEIALEAAAASGQRALLDRALAAAGTRLDQGSRIWQLRGVHAAGVARYDAAAAAFERALELDPQAADTAIALLSSALNTADRELLRRAVLRTTPVVQDDPRSFAALGASHLALGQPGPAAVWLRREVAHRPDSFVARLELAKSLELAGDVTGAANAREDALGLPAPPPTAGTDQLLAYAELLERGRGLDAAVGWAEASLARAAPDERLEDYAFALHVRAEAPSTARAWLDRKRRAGRRPSGWQRLALAQLAGDEAELEAVLAQHPELSPGDRAFALERLGRRHEAFVLARRSGLSGVAERLAPDVLPRLDVGLEQLTSGEERLWQLRAAADTGELIGPRVGLSTTRRWALDGSRASTEVMVGGRFDLLRSRSRVAGGLEWGDGAPLLRLDAAHGFNFGPNASVQASLALNERIVEGPAARRDQLAATVTLGTASRHGVAFAARAARHKDVALQADALGFDAIASATPYAPLPLSVRLTASADRYWATEGAWPAVFASGGAGATWRFGGRHLRGELDGWGGWLLPTNVPGYRVAVGLRVPLDFGQIAGHAYVSNARSGLLSHGVGLTFSPLLGW